MEDTPQEYLEWLRETDCHPPETCDNCPSIDKTGYNCHGWDPYDGKKAPCGEMDEETFIYFQVNDLFGPCKCPPNYKHNCKCGTVFVVVDDYNDIVEARSVEFPSCCTRQTNPPSFA